MTVRSLQLLKPKIWSRYKWSSRHFIADFTTCMFINFWIIKMSIKISKQNLLFLQNNGISKLKLKESVSVW